MRALTLSRLDEIETLSQDFPDDAPVEITARDLRDFVSLIPVVRAAERLRNSLDEDATEIGDVVCAAFEAYDHVRPLSDEEAEAGEREERP